LGTQLGDAVMNHQLFTYQQASRGEIDFVKTTIRSNPAQYGKAGGILARDPTNSANFALLVYDFEKYNVIFSITQEHVCSSQGTVALCEMAAQGNLTILDFLLDRGMDPNSRNSRGVTPLAIAITRGQVEAVKLLLRRGSNPNLVYFDSFASLQQAVEQYLLGQERQLPAMISIYREIVEALLASGADIAQAKRLSSRAGTGSISTYLEKLERLG
jgi:ankyrin repeat protein